MQSTSSIVRPRSRSTSAAPRIDEEDEKKQNTICTSGKDIYSSVLGPTVDETLLLGLQTFLGIGSNGEGGGARARLNIVASRKSMSDLGREVEQASLFNSVIGDLNGVEGGELGGELSIKSTRFAPCRYEDPEKFLDQEVQTLLPGYAFKCSKAVACPPKCKVGVQNFADDDILIGTTDSIVGTDQGYNFGGQTAGPHIGSRGSQTGDLVNTSSSQTSRITLNHAPVQTQRRSDSATYSLIPQMSNKQLSTSPELLPGLEDCSCSTDSLPAIPTKRKPTRVSQKTSLSRCNCGRSCPTLKRRTVKKKIVRVCCNCPSTTTEAKTDRSFPSFASVPGCVGDTNQQEVTTKYAITKITTFASYTTFEVMKCTRKKPRCMPSSVMGVFVLKNFEDTNS